MALRGVLFDLDGTLLDIDMDAFLRRYFTALGYAASTHFPDVAFMPALLASTAAMQRPHPGMTNKEVFDEDFRSRTGVDIEVHHAVFDEFYREVFPTLGEGYGPLDGARDVITAARSLGLKVAVATQPIFPAVAIGHRLGWAGLAGDDFDAVTTYETMRSCKPQAAYFEQTAAMIGLAPGECLMVGNDAEADMPASDTGMRTFYVGVQRDVFADHSGTMADLRSLLERLV